MEGIKFDSDSRVQEIRLEHVQELYEFLQGKLPDCISMKPRPKLSQRRAFQVIWFLQERLGLIPDNYDRCVGCGVIYDSNSEGDRINYKNYCGDCL